MNYETRSFGEKIKTIRKELGLTQKDVFEMSGINIETIRRLENGMVIPKFETLDLLTKVYKKDICSIFLSFRIHDFNQFNIIRNNLEKKAASYDFSDFELMTKELDVLIENTSTPHFITMLKQLKSYYTALKVYKDRDYETSRKICNEAMEKTCPGFNLEEPEKWYYSETEINIIMLMSLIESRQGKIEQAERLLIYLKDTVNTEGNIRKKILSNLAVIYMRSGEYGSALKIYDQILSSDPYRNDLLALNLIYYNIGICQFHQKDPHFSRSFKTAIILCYAKKDIHMMNLLINNIQRYVNLDYSYMLDEFN